MERQGSAKENAETPALLFTEDSSAYVRVRMDAVLALIIGDTTFADRRRETKKFFLQYRFRSKFFDVEK